VSAESFVDDRVESRRALLSSIAPRGAADSDGKGNVDWAWVLDRARAHRVAAIAALRLRGSPRLSEEERRVVEQAREQARRKTSDAERTLALLAGRFGEEGIPFLVTKGIVLSERVYPRNDMRDFSDVDLVVRPEHVGTAARLLESSGFRLGQVRQTLGVRPGADDLAAARRLTRWFYERFDYELPFLAGAKSGLLPIDLHWRLAPRRRLAIEAEALWKETQPVTVGGVTVTTLTSEATLIHLAVHATTCTFASFRLLHLCDVAWALHRSAHSPRRLWNLAADWGADRHLAVVFETTSRLFGVPAPRGEAPAGGLSRVARPSFLVDEPRASLGARIRREALWGWTMGCLGSNVERSVGVRLARAAWRGRGLLRRARGVWP
jgi:hypothetical protein